MLKVGIMVNIKAKKIESKVLMKARFRYLVHNFRYLRENEEKIQGERRGQPI